MSSPIHISFFGRLADVLGARSLSLESAMDSGDALKTHLTAAHPEISEILAHQGTRLVVNDEIVDWATTLSASDDIAIIPVVSGG